MPDRADKRVVTRGDLEEEARNVLGYLMHVFGEGRIGIAIYLFEFGEGGNLAYISNTRREDMIKTMEEWLARVKVGLHTDPPGPRAQG